VAVAVAGIVATLIVAFGPSSRSNRAAAGERAAPAETGARHASARVAVFGDSLMLQAGSAVAALGRAHGLSVSVTAYFGLAPCDLAPLVRQSIATRPGVLVLAFSGNNLTPCMQRDGRPLSGDAYYEKYKKDLGALVAFAAARHVPVELVAPPVFPADLDTPPRARLVAQYARLALEHPGVRLVKTATALGGPAYVTSMPCVTGERAALGCQDGRIVTRDASRIHFDDPRTVGCPIVGHVCTYSAGAHRYAATIVDGLAAVAGLDYRPAPPTAGIPVDLTGTP
jgi:hypothetical protein